MLLAAVLFFSGCSDEGNPTTPPVDTEHPPPTTMTLQLVRLDAGGNPTTDTTRATVRDTTQTPSKIPVEGMLELQAGASYAGTFILYDESQTPAEDVTPEIVAEQDSHLFVPMYEQGSALIINGLSKDSKGFDFGLNFTAQAVRADTGRIHVMLLHFDSGDKNSDEYDTDIDQYFPVTITE